VRSDVEQIDGGGKYLPFARRRRDALDNARKLANVPDLRSEMKIGNARITIVVSDDKSLIRIKENTGGSFLFHPRTGDIINRNFPKTVSGAFGPYTVYESHRMVDGNGFNPAGEALPNGSYAYPIIDGDHGTRTIEHSNDEWTYDPNPAENYGNIDWTTKEDVLTWKGSPSRHFPLDATLSINGLTVSDEEVGDITYYTLFTPNIYRDGAVYAVAPHRVLGAALSGIYTVSVLGANYRGETNPDGGTGGFYYEAWVREGGGVDLYDEETSPGGWRRMSWQVASRFKVPWFFSRSGFAAVAVQSGIRYDLVVSDDYQSATFTSQSAGDGTISESREVSSESLRTYPGETPPDIFSLINPASEDAKWDGAITGTRNYGVTEVGKTGTLAIASDFAKNTTLTCVMQRESSDTTTIESIRRQIYQLIPNIKYAADPSLSATVFYRGYGDAIQVDDYVGVSGGCSPYSFSFNQGEISSNGTITSVSSCSENGYVATGTITVQDSGGHSVALEVKLPGGYWYTEGGESARGVWWDDYGWQQTTSIFTPVISGNTKYDGKYFGVGCFYGCSGCMCPGQTCTSSCSGNDCSTYDGYPTTIGLLTVPPDSSFTSEDRSLMGCTPTCPTPNIITCLYKVTNRIASWTKYEWRCS